MKAVSSSDSAKMYGKSGNNKGRQEALPRLGFDAQSQSPIDADQA